MHPGDPVTVEPCAVGRTARCWITEIITGEDFDWLRYWVRVTRVDGQLVTTSGIWD